MFRKLLTHPTVHLAITGLIALGVLLCVFPDVVPRFSWVVNHAVQLMLFYLFAGLVMLFLKQPKLTFAFFVGCVLLCFFLKFSVKGDGIERWRQQMFNKHYAEREGENVRIDELKVAHINLTNANQRQEIADVLRGVDADIISLHELTPDWEYWLTDSIVAMYPHRHNMVDLGIYGMAIYSKYQLKGIDTLFFHEVPNLTGRIEKDGRPFNFFSVHTQPALDDFSKQRLKNHLAMVGEAVNRTNGPILVIGDFNAVSWSGQVQLFMDATGLMESRTGFMPTSWSGKVSLWDVPLDHIFYSGEFVCSDFQNIDGKKGQHLGIMGIYQFAIRTKNAEKQDQ